MTAEPVGLIAGAGRYPITFARKARETGVPVVCVGIAGMADPELIPICHRFHWLHRLSLGFIIRSFRRGGVKRWMMAGKFHKHVVYTPWMLWRFLPDWRALRFWFFRRRVNNGDDAVMLGLIEEFRRVGMECVSALDVCPEVLVREGVLTRRSPTSAEEADIQFGWDVAKQLGQLDIGQSVMIRNRTVVAVEAIEGTDRAILRAGELCGGARFVVVKVAKPQQDRRFDVPTIGRDTIETMSKAGAKVLAVEAGQTIILDEPDTVALADHYGIAIIALRTPPC